MIRHLVLARLDAGSAAEWAQVMRSLSELVDELEGAQGMRWGRNETPEVGMDQGFSQAFVVDFDDAAARDTYLADARHVALGERIVALVRGGVEGLVVCDLLLNDANG